MAEASQGDVSATVVSNAQHALNLLQKEVANCTSCPLGSSRTQVVFGTGNVGSPLIFIGEGPGQKEDEQGEPFVGRSGQLLNRLIYEELNVERGMVYIANIVKCRPPGNRNPTPAEIAACTPFLKRQLDQLNYKLIVALGSVAARYFIGDTCKITKEHGLVYETQFGMVIPMYHPSYLLRTGGLNVSSMRADLVGAKMYLKNIGQWPW